MQAYNVYSQLLRADTAIGATVATTVAGLGTATDGKIGLIRAGSTPFDFVQVIYDATYAKWVSAPFFIIRNGTGANNGVAPGSPLPCSLAGGGAGTEYGFASGIIKHKPMTDAGLGLQVQSLGRWSVSSGTATMK